MSTKAILHPSSQHCVVCPYPRLEMKRYTIPTGPTKGVIGTTDTYVLHTNEELKIAVAPVKLSAIGAYLYPGQEVSIDIIIYEHCKDDGLRKQFSCGPWSSFDLDTLGNDVMVTFVAEGYPDWPMTAAALPGCYIIQAQHCKPIPIGPLDRNPVWMPTQ